MKRVRGIGADDYAFKLRISLLTKEYSTEANIKVTAGSKTKISPGIVIPNYWKKSYPHHLKFIT